MGSGCAGRRAYAVLVCRWSLEASYPVHVPFVPSKRNGTWRSHPLRMGAKFGTISFLTPAFKPCVGRMALGQAGLGDLGKLPWPVTALTRPSVKPVSHFELPNDTLIRNI